MVKMYCTPDEWYPIFTMSSEGKEVAEFTQAEIIEYKKIEAEFTRWQEILSNRYREEER